MARDQRNHPKNVLLRSISIIIFVFGLWELTKPWSEKFVYQLSMAYIPSRYCNPAGTLITNVIIFLVLALGIILFFFSGEYS